MLPHLLGRAEASPSISLPDGPYHPTGYQALKPAGSRALVCQLGAQDTSNREIGNT